MKQTNTEKVFNFDQIYADSDFDLYLNPLDSAQRKRYVKQLKLRSRDFSDNLSSV